MIRRLPSAMLWVGAAVVVVAASWIRLAHPLDQGRGGYVTVVLATFVMLTVSVLREASLWRKTPA